MVRIKQILFFVFVLCCVACKGDKQTDSGSQGNINEISIIISDVLWNGEVGDGIRRKFAAPVDGLTQEEPLYTLNQYHEKTFTGALSKGRNIIIVERKGGKAKFAVVKNKNCKPQNVFTISAKSIDELLELIDMHADEVIMKIRETEITEYQSKNQKAGLLDEKVFKDHFGISMQVPLTYKQALNNDNFLWLKHDIPSGNTSLLVYKVPFHVIEKDKTLIKNIISMRDSIGNMYIHGQEAGTYMVTEEAYSPYIFMTSFKEHRAFETRGNWEMANDFMNGPFLNYAIKDDKRKCYLIVEGFIYSPSSPKRDMLTELESIIKSVTFL
jgi:hypothetical protein